MNPPDRKPGRLQATFSARELGIDQPIGPWVQWFPVLMVLISFLTIVIFPIVMNVRANRFRTEITTLAEPARARVLEVNLQLAIQVSTMRGYLLTGNEGFLLRYKLARARQERAFADLRPAVEQMGGEAARSYSELEGYLDKWHGPQDMMLMGQLERSEIIPTLPESQLLYEQIMDTTGTLAEAIAASEARLRQRILQTQQVAMVFTIGLVLLGLISTVAVLWLAMRVKAYALQLQRRAQDELAFRQAASALSGALETDQILYEVSRSAAHVTGADGAYVEKVIAPDGEVEVVTTLGRGTPDRGLRVPYPGSLTDELISGAAPVIISDLSQFGRSMAPYLERRCPSCEVLIIPLMATGEPLGALVLVNTDPSTRGFAETDIVRAAVLADLASIALRRVRIVQKEREARAAAEQAVRARDEVLGIVSHDLRNPLTAVLLSATMLKELPPGQQDEEIDSIVSSAQRMQRLINDLLDVAKMEGGRLSLKMSEINPAELVEDATEAFRSIAAERRLRIESEIPPEVAPPFRADRDRLLQVFGNLIGNAVKFTPAGGAIFVRAAVAGSAFRFSVQDQGPGIMEKDLPHVFERHWQAKKTAHLGAGLGLAIARGIVESHGGRIEVENAPEGGARFSFTVPRNPPARS
jgi:signal transduction histidine kinase/CHASE3 domain sensor protein